MNLPKKSNTTSRLSETKFNSSLSNVEEDVNEKETEKEKEKEQEKEKEINCGSDRVKNDVVPLIRTPLKQKVLFPNSNSIPDHLALRSHFKREGKLNKNDLITIVRSTRKIFCKENNLITLSSPVVIFGDLHGQFFDLVNYIETIGECDPETNKFLFLGDYVDRGVFGIEIVLYLFSLKIIYPNGCFLLRDEVIEKYDVEVYEEIMKTFDCLPLAAIVDKQFFCVHGGISPKLKKVESINLINRFREPPTKGLFGDLLWSDPDPNYNEPELTTNFFQPNEPRSCSVLYSFQAVRRFLLMNKLTCIIRAHEAQDDGFKMYLKRKETKFPSLITIFSSPNYIGVYNNKAAIFKYQPNAVTLKEFQSVEQPYWLPKFMDVFEWSIPFLIEKTMSIVKTIVSIKENESLDLFNDVSDIIDEDDETYISDDEQDVKSGIKKNQNQINNGNDDNGNDNIFLSIQRGEIIKNKIRLLLVLMADFNIMRKKKGTRFLRVKGIQNVRRGHSVMISSVFKRNPSNPFELQRKTVITKKGLLRSFSYQDVKLEDKLLQRILGKKLKKLSLKEMILKNNKQLNISNSKTKSIVKNSSNRNLEDENEKGNGDSNDNNKENDNDNDNVFEREIEELSKENEKNNKNNIPEVIEIERVNENQLTKIGNNNKVFNHQKEIENENKENDDEDQVWIFNN
ncbi:serine/threonine-protein phosphatase 2b catalytic subunit 1-related [Anaeramoeba flamelloides]|uniref:Serine/threonine-protein phosphatase 2b catalytic subunit 1-related n=1 Tax=Anaeramoeba flamelloides TaxID=1746091 RepID=A0AAV7YGH9_9EUKA|nr:serine/threonine-protein phosphatase 2b catalytic subunit 1-related [Anaeramoeba flamelloides]